MEKKFTFEKTQVLAKVPRHRCSSSTSPSHLVSRGKRGLQELHGNRDQAEPVWRDELRRRSGLLLQGLL